MKIKIFKMNECDWIAAETLEDAKQCLADLLNGGETDFVFEDEYVSNPHEISEEAMNRLKLWDEDDLYNATKDYPKYDDDYKKAVDRYRESCPTFKQALDKMIADGDKFPTMFASSEY